MTKYFEIGAISKAEVAKRTGYQLTDAQMEDIAYLAYQHAIENLHAAIEHCAEYHSSAVWGQVKESEDE